MQNVQHLSCNTTIYIVFCTVQYFKTDLLILLALFSSLCSPMPVVVSLTMHLILLTLLLLLDLSLTYLAFYLTLFLLLISILEVLNAFLILIAEISIMIVIVVIPILLCHPLIWRSLAKNQPVKNWKRAHRIPYLTPAQIKIQMLTSIQVRKDGIICITS